MRIPLGLAAVLVFAVAAGADLVPQRRAGHAAPPPMLAAPPPPMASGAPRPMFAVPPPPLLAAPPPPMLGFEATRDYRMRAAVSRTRYDALIRDVAERHGVEYALVKAMIQAESDFDHLAVSPKGARGLMQLMPETAARQGVGDIFSPRDNIEGGCRYLRSLLERFRGNLPLAVAAYNAGEQRVEDARGIPAIAETREYLARVLTYRQAYLR